MRIIVYLSGLMCLLLGAGSPPFDVSTAYYLTQDGAWCWFSDPRAIYVQGKIITGWVKSDGSIESAMLDPKTQEIRYQTLYEQLQRDDHNNPAFVETKDGNIMAVYTTHSGRDGFFQHISDSLADIRSFGKPTKVHLLDSAELARFPKIHVTYANPFRLEKEAQRIYCFGRWTGYKPNMMWSDDQGKSWSRSRVFATRYPFDPDNRPYAKYFSDGQSRIHIVFTDGHPRSEPQNSVYYAYYEAGAFYRVDGSLIRKTEDLPFTYDEASKVYSYQEGEGRAWLADIAQDEQGYPVILYTKSPTENDHRYRYARYDGTNWIQHEICKGGAWFPQTKEGEIEREPHYFGNMSLSPENPNVVYLSREVQGVFEIERWETQNLGKSWTSRAITRGSRYDQVRPYLPRYESDGQEIVLWMENRRYVHYTDYQSAIRYWIGPK